MNIIYVGNIVDPQTINGNPGISVAGNSFQLSLVNALSHYCHVDVVSSVPHRTFHGKKEDVLFIKSEKQVIGNLKLAQFGYINIPIIKHFCAYIAVLARVKQLIRSEEQATILVYNTVSFIVQAIARAVKGTKTRVIPIIADVPLPEYRSLLWRIEARKELENIARFNKLIVLSALTAQELGKTDDYLVLEGGCADERNDQAKSSTAENSIMFSGSLNELSGIDLLLDAMEIVRQTIPGSRLDIYGDGVLREYVEKRCKGQENMFFHGKKEHTYILQKQRESAVLVSPRRPDEFVTRYTFPSKLIEYLCSGTPVISNRLAGIPEEYEELLNYTDESSADALAKTIIEVLQSYSVFKEKAIIAAQYVCEHKNWENQAQRIVSFIEMRHTK